MQGGNEVDYPGVINELPTQQMRRYRAPRQSSRIQVVVSSGW